MIETLQVPVDQMPVMYPSEIDAVKAIANHARDTYMQQRHDHIEAQVAQEEQRIRTDIAEGTVYANPDRAVFLAKQWRREKLLREGARFAMDRALVARYRHRHGLDT
jgi:hypothetical protein